MTIPSKYLAFAGLLLFSVVAIADGSQRYGLPITKADIIFLSQLRKAVACGNKEWVMDHTSLPLVVNIDGKRTSLLNRKTLKLNYDAVFNAKVKRAIALQQGDRLFKTWRGVMVGDGELWFVAVHPEAENHEKIKYYIIGINN